MSNKLKKYSVKFAVVFFAALIFLTYFSSTIDNMLLPRVKISDITAGTLSQEDGSTLVTKYLIPLSSVVAEGDRGTVFVIDRDSSDKPVVKEVNVDIVARDDLYYEVTSQEMYTEMKVVYKTSKSISSGDKVYIEEDSYD